MLGGGVNNAATNANDARSVGIVAKKVNRALTLTTSLKRARRGKSQKSVAANDNVSLYGGRWSSPAD